MIVTLPPYAVAGDLVFATAPYDVKVDFSYGFTTIDNGTWYRMLTAHDIMVGSIAAPDATIVSLNVTLPR